MNSTIKNTAMVAVLFIVACAALTGCDDRTGTAPRSPARTESAPVSNNDTVTEAFEEPQGFEEAPTAPGDVAVEPAESASADGVATTLADARTSFGETMRALAELLEASQQMQRELLDAPDRFSSPDRADNGGDGENEKEG